MNLKNSNPARAGKIVARIMGGLFAVCAGVVVVNEGSSNKAYKDSAGVWTICYGETKDVKPGDTKTNAECSAQLAKSLQEHAGALEGLPAKTPDSVLVGGVDMAYNVGVTAFRNAAVKRHLMKSDYAAAGAAVLDWRYISKPSRPANSKGWVYNSNTKRWQFDCSQTFNGVRNKVCWGLWERRQWQSKAIGNQYSSAQEALAALKSI